MPFVKEPRIIGHELGVRVKYMRQEGGDFPFREGSLCAVEPYLYCSKCSACRRGHTNCCRDLQVLGVHTEGGFCQELVVPLTNLHSSKHLSKEQLALVETLAIGAHAVRRACISKGESVLVIGGGPIGIGALVFAKEAGAEVTLMEAREARRVFCARHFGCRTYDSDEGARSEFLATTNREGVGVVIECTGSDSVLREAVDFVRYGAGRLVHIGVFDGDVAFPFESLRLPEVALLQSRNATGGDFQRVIKALKKGVIPADEMITHRCPLSELEGSFAKLIDPEQSPDLIKAMVAVSDEEKGEEFVYSDRVAALIDEQRSR